MFCGEALLGEEDGEKLSLSPNMAGVESKNEKWCGIERTGSEHRHGLMEQGLM